LGPIPNPQSPIPNPQSPIPNPQYFNFIIYKEINKYKFFDKKDKSKID
jgi:hypothetical protein